MKMRHLSSRTDVVLGPTNLRVLAARNMAPEISLFAATSSLFHACIIALPSTRPFVSSSVSVVKSSSLAKYVDGKGGKEQTQHERSTRKRIVAYGEVKTRVE